MKRYRTPRAVATALTVLFTALWWWVAIASVVVALVVLTGGVNVGVQIGPNGEPNFVAIEGWNAATVYQQAIAYIGQQIDGQ